MSKNLEIDVHFEIMPLMCRKPRLLFQNCIDIMNSISHRALEETQPPETPEEPFPSPPCITNCPGLQLSALHLQFD